MRDARVVDGIAGLERTDGPLYAVVGVFDGLHRGHAWMIRRLVRLAAARGARPTVITFDHHPDEVIRGTAPPLLLDPAERIARLEAAGVDIVVVVHFDDRLRRTGYEEFVAAIASRAALAGFVMSVDSAFGHERRGTPDRLALLGTRLGFEVTVVEPFVVDGIPVTSTAIRTAIADGDIRRASRLLGRPVAVTGTGDGIDGRRLTFPVPVALPPAGTYRASVGPAIIPGGADGWLPRRRVVTVESGTIALATAAGPDRRLRVAFRS
jgi:riboflavin kinase/FMN adenylyltransferase